MINNKKSSVVEEINKTKIGVITNTQNLRFRTSPNITDDNVACILPNGYEITVIEINGEWAKVKLADSEYYCLTKFLKIEE